MAHIVSDEDRFLSGMAAAALEQSAIRLNGELEFLTLDCEAAFSGKTLGNLPPVLFRRAVRLAVQALGGGLEQNQVAVIEAGIRDGTSGSVSAEGGEIALEWSPDSISVRRVHPDAPFRFPLTVPGETDSPEFGWIFLATVESRQPSEQRRGGFEAVIGQDSIKGPLYFRPAESGDTIQPFGFEGHRKVSDILSEAHLTLAARRRLPIICDMVGPVWIPGHCLSNRVKLQNNPSHAVCIRFGPLETTRVTSAPFET
jgi:tRNA(Ile)-lysidine synthase